MFGDGISIEDTMGVLVRYNNKAILNYSLNTYLPWEGFIVVFNGSKGRIEVRITEQSYINSGGEKEEEGALVGKEIKVYPMFDAPYEVEVPDGHGGHGGGDELLLRDIFDDQGAMDSFRRAATHVDGAMSILTGIAANRAIRTGMPVRVSDLVKFRT